MPKPLAWIGRSLDDMRSLPDAVQDAFGFGLYRVQCGEHPANAKPLTGMGGIVELIEDFDRNTYRAVYAARFASGVYVLHVFQKKAKRGIATPKADVETIRRRFKEAQQEDEKWRRDASERRH